MKHPVGYTRNGMTVYVDLIRSRAAKHIAQQPHLLGLVEEVLRQTALQGPAINLEHDMGRVIGYSSVVSTTDADTVFYAQLLRDTTYTRFVKNGKPLPTPYLTIVLRSGEGKGSYELYDTWIGRLSLPLPGSA